MNVFNNKIKIIFQIYTLGYSIIPFDGVLMEVFKILEGLAGCSNPLARKGRQAKITIISVTACAVTESSVTELCVTATNVIDFP